jgi:hypothetical protein
MPRLVLAALACLLALAGTAQAALVTLTGQAAYGTNPASVGDVAFDITLDTDAATARSQGGFLLRDVAGTVTIDGTDFSFADARVVARQRGSGTNVLALRLGDAAGQTNLRLTLVGGQGPAAPDFLSAVLAAAGYDTLRFQTDGPLAANVDSDAFSAAVPLPPAAFLFAGPVLAFAVRQKIVG